MALKSLKFTPSFPVPVAREEFETTELRAKQKIDNLLAQKEDQEDEMREEKDSFNKNKDFLPENLKENAEFSIDPGLLSELGLTNEELVQAQKEFNELPEKLQKKLIAELRNLSVNNVVSNYKEILKSEELKKSLNIALIGISFLITMIPAIMLNANIENVSKVFLGSGILLYFIANIIIRQQTKNKISNVIETLSTKKGDLPLDQYSDVTDVDDYFEAGKDRKDDKIEKIKNIKNNIKPLKFWQRLPKVYIPE